MIWAEVTAPTAEPVTLAEAKLHLRVDHTEEDDKIERNIATARRYVERVTGSQLMPATIDVFLDSFPTGDTAIEIPRPPLSSVTSIKYIDTDGNEQTESSSVYTVDTVPERAGRVYLAHDQSWSSARVQRKAVTLRCVIGYADADSVPSTYKDAILLITDDLFNHRTSESELQTHGNETADRLIWSERSGCLI